MSYFLRYLPQLIREKYLNQQKDVVWEHHPVTKTPMFDYSEMDEPYFTMAFANGKTPITWYYVPVKVEAPEVGWYYGINTVHEFHTGKTILVESTRVKAVYYDEFTSERYEPVAYEVTHRPGDYYYEYMLALPLLREETPDRKLFGHFAMRDWKLEHGEPKCL